MSIPQNLPKGCTSSRGVSGIRHVGDRSGGLTTQANRLYMLTMRRESLLNKKQSLERRLKDINELLIGIEVDLQETEKIFAQLKAGPKHGSKTEEEAGNGKRLRKMPLHF